MPEDSAPESRFRSIGEIAQDMLSGMQKCCSQATGYGKKEAAAEGATNTCDGLTETRLIGASEMTALTDYKPIRLGTIGEHSENFPASPAPSDLGGGK